MVVDQNSKHFQKVKEGDHVSILCCITASGRDMKPLIIFKGKSFKALDSNDFYVTASENGWVDGNIKKFWPQHFLTYIDKSKKYILLLDGHSSNLDSDFIQEAKNNNIEVIAFPANLTHLLQPLDRNFFRILKDFLRLELIKKENLEKWDIADLLVDPFQHASTRGTIISSFAIPGIYPTEWKLEAYFSNLDEEEEDDEIVINSSTTPSLPTSPITSSLPSLTQVPLPIINTMITQEISDNKLIEANTSYSISKTLIQQYHPQELIELTNELIENYN